MTNLEIILSAAVPLSTLVGALIGAWIGGKFTLTAVEKTHKRNIATQKANQERIINNFLQAIHDEVDTLWNNYNSMAGVTIGNLKDGDALTIYYPIPLDIFTIYNGNSSLIGSVQDSELRKAIITTYGNARSLIESHRLNNEFVQKYEYWERLYTANPPDDKSYIFPPNLDDSFRILQDYAKIIKKRHEDVKESVTNLLIKIKENRINFINNIHTRR